MVSSRADPSEPLSIPSRSPLVPRPSFPFSTFVFSVIAVLLASQAGLSAADSSSDDLGTVTWIFPKGGEVFHHLDTVNVSYQSSYSEPWLYIWCYINQTANTVRFSKPYPPNATTHVQTRTWTLRIDASRAVRKREVEPYDASVLIYMDFSTSTPCWFNLRDNTNSNKGRNTENWSLKQSERQSGPITTGAPVSSATATSTTASTSRPSSSAAAAAASATAAAGASSNDGISAGGKAGLGIGVGIGTSLLCAGAFWLYYRHVKRKEHHQEVYRRIVGGQGGGAAPGHDAFTTPNNEHLEPWRYGGTPQPAPSAVGSAWSGVSDPSTEWYPGQTTTTANAPYQYYDPVGSSHQLGAMAGAAGVGAASSYYHRHPPPPSVLTTASMAAEPPPSVAGGPSSISHHHSTDHVPEAAAIRDVQDLSSSLYPSEYNEPVSPVSAADRSIPPTRVASVNYGPNGPRDASTGADFTLLPDYTAPVGGEEDPRMEQEDIYGPPTPRSPPPPHSAHAHIAGGQHLPQQQHQETIAQELAAWQHGSHSAGGAHVVELPTAQTHRGYGPQAELPAGDVGGVQPPPLRQQRSDLRGPEQKVLLQDVGTLRSGQHRDGG